MWNVAKKSVLADFINIPARDIKQVNELFTAFDSQFAVLTDEEADIVAREGARAELTDEDILPSDEDIESAIEENGRAYYIAADGEESEEGAFYIYRLN